MKKILTLLFVCGLFFQASAVVSHYGEELQQSPDFQALDAEIKNMDVEGFLALTPSVYKERTGKKLGIKKAIQLKVAQKIVKRKIKKMEKAGNADIPKGLFIVLAILGWAWLVMGLMDDWSGNNWWVALLLTVLCWLPGVIYSLVKMKDYY